VPVTFWDQLHHIILPATVLALAYIAAWSRYLRSSMLEVLHQDYLRTARAKGFATDGDCAEACFRNALIPLVTVVALDVGGIFAAR